MDMIINSNSMQNIKKLFGLKLKQVRINKNLTQEKLAELVDINPRQLSRIESGNSFPSVSTLEKMCTVLDVLPVDLFNFTDKKLEELGERIKMPESIENILESEQKLKFLELAIRAVNNDKKALLKIHGMIEGMLVLQNL